eukprot:257836_1
MVTNYPLALNLIRNRQSNEQYAANENHQQAIDQNAELLYGLIHVRFILTKAGLNRMKDKYYLKHFGVCHRHDCWGQYLLPVGLTDEINKETVRLYCPNCNALYVPQNELHRSLDGAYFGTTFAHYFLLSFPHLIPRETSVNQYAPKIFGFKLHASWHEVALYGKRSKRHIKKKQEQKQTKKKDKKENQVEYLRVLCEKQTEEILRLDEVIKKHKKDIKKLKAVKKKQGIQLLAAATQIDVLQQEFEELNYHDGYYAHEAGVAPMPEEYDDNNEEHYEREPKKSRKSGKHKRKKTSKKKKKVQKKELIINSEEDLEEDGQVQRMDEHVYIKKKVAVFRDQDEDENSLTG